MREVKVKLYLNPVFIRQLRKGFMYVTGEDKAAAAICKLLILIYFQHGTASLPNMDTVKAYLPGEFDDQVAPVTIGLTLEQADLLTEVQRQVPFRLPFATIVHQVILLALGYSLETILTTVNKENFFKTKEEVLESRVVPLLPTRKDGTIQIGGTSATIADKYLI